MKIEPKNFRSDIENTSLAADQSKLLTNKAMHFFSSPLETEHLHRNRKCGGEQDGESENHGCNHPKEIVSVPKIDSHVLFHSLAAALKGCLYVAELRRHQPVQGPRNGTCPAVPSPPERHPLLLGIVHIRESKLCSRSLKGNNL